MKATLASSLAASLIAGLAQLAHCLASFATDQVTICAMRSTAAAFSRELGWKPAEPFASGLRKTVLWYLDHAAWIDDIARTRYARSRLGHGPVAGSSDPLRP